MKLAIPVWLGRVSPVLDVAGRLLLVDVVDGQEFNRQEAALPETPAVARVQQFLDLGVEQLICGGVSAELEGMLTHAGISVTSLVCGDLEDVLGAWLGGRLGDERYLMPGCCRRRRRMRSGCGRGRGGWNGVRGVTR